MTVDSEKLPEIRAERTLNCRGMRCPLPVIYTRKALAPMPAGEVLMVVATDPGSVDDFVEFSQRSHTELVAHREDGGDYIFFLRKV
jgi:tRNA 2-thiouridine synthesizing protein A